VDSAKKSVLTNTLELDNNIFMCDVLSVTFN